MFKRQIKPDQNGRYLQARYLVYSMEMVELRLSE